MSVKVENLEKNMAKLTVEVDAAELEKALERAYQKQKKSISVPGFRKGKVPRQLVEKMYGPQVFYDDAANDLLSKEYPRAYDECGLEIASQPKINIEQLEKGKNFIFTAEVAVKPEVKLADYKGIEVTKIDTDVTDDEVNTEIDLERNKNSRTVTVDRAIEKGDTANINFEGFVDGQAFDGGKGENYDLKIGSGSFIDNFEDQLIGHRAGDELEVNVTFPENYQEKSLAGKAASFKVKVNEVKTTELPDLDDEFAQDVSEFDSLDEYKADVRKKLEERKKEQAKRTQQDEAVAKLAEASEMEIPDPMVDFQLDQMMNEFSQNMAQQGLSMQQYLQFTGMNMAQFREQARPDALSRIQSSLVLEALAKAEGLVASDEDVEEELKKMADSYKMELDKVKELVDESQRENMKKDLAIQKAVDLIYDNVREVEKKEEDKKEEPEKEE
ncbi:trigger factor [Shuttleworthella satelles]|nr:trigger factor [Shuttleworthia satelles]